MATIRPVGRWVARGVYETKWTGVTGSGSVIVPEQGPRLPDKTIYVTGTLESGTISIKGSNLATASDASGASFAVLSDPHTAEALTGLTSGDVAQVLENPLLIAPTCSGATGGTSATVVMISRGGGR